MAVRYTLTATDVIEYVGHIYRKGNKAGRIISIVAIALLICYLFIIIFGDHLPDPGKASNFKDYFIATLQWRLPFFVVGILLALYLLKWRYNLFAKNTYNSSRELSSPKEMSWDENGIHLISEYMDVVYKWGLFEKVVETDNLIILYTSKNTAQILPIRAFDAASLSEFKAMAHTKVGNETAKRQLPDHLVS